MEITIFPLKSEVGVMDKGSVVVAVGPKVPVTEFPLLLCPPKEIVKLPAVAPVTVKAIWYFHPTVAAKVLVRAVVFPVVCVQPVAKSPVQSVEVQPEEVSNSLPSVADSLAAIDF